MGWKKTAASNKDFDRELPPAGNHPAVLVALVDLGTHEDDFGGKISHNRKVYLCWELTAEDNRPVIGRDFTFSLNAKALLRQFIARWRGRDLADGEEFDVSVLVGQKCMLTVEHYQKNDKNRAKVSGVAGVPKGFTVPPAKRTPFLWSIEDEDADVADLPDWIPWLWGSPLREWAERCQEWRTPAPPANPGASFSPAAVAASQEAGASGSILPDDEAPF